MCINVKRMACTEMEYIMIKAGNRQIMNCKFYTYFNIGIYVLLVVRQLRSRRTYLIFSGSINLMLKPSKDPACLSQAFANLFESELSQVLLCLKKICEFCETFH